MKGILFAVIGGAFIILQGTFNAKLSSDIGIWSTSIITHLIGFVVATSVFFIKKAGTVKDLKSVFNIWHFWSCYYLCNGDYIKAHKVFFNAHPRNQLYVNREVGTTRMPIRFWSKPELSVFSLKNR